MALKLDDFKPFLKSYTGTLALVDNELTADEMYFWDGSYIKDGAVLYVENAYIIKGKPGKGTAKKRQYPCNHISIRGKTTPAEGNILVLVSNLNGGGEKMYSTVANFGIGPIDPIGRGLPTGLNSTMQLDGNTKLYTTATPVSNWITIPTQVAVGITQPLLSSDITTDTDSKTLHLTGNSYFDAAGTDLAFTESSVLSDNVTGFVSLTGTASGTINGFTIPDGTDVEITYVDGALVVKTAGPITVNGQEMPAGAVIGGDSTNPTFTYSHQTVWGVSSDSPLTITVTGATTFKMTSLNNSLNVGGVVIATDGTTGLPLTSTAADVDVDSVTDPRFTMTKDNVNTVSVNVQLDNSGGSSTVVLNSSTGIAVIGGMASTKSVTISNDPLADVKDSAVPADPIALGDTDPNGAGMSFGTMKIGTKVETTLKGLRRQRRFRDAVVPFITATEAEFHFNNAIYSNVGIPFNCEYPTGTYRYIFPDDTLGVITIGNTTGSGKSEQLKQLEFNNIVITEADGADPAKTEANVLMIGGNATFAESDGSGGLANKLELSQVDSVHPNLDVNYNLHGSLLKLGVITCDNTSDYTNKNDTLDMNVVDLVEGTSVLAHGDTNPFTFRIFN